MKAQPGLRYRRLGERGLGERGLGERGFGDPRLAERRFGPWMAGWLEPATCRVLLALLVAGLICLGPEVAQACPTCKDGLAQNDPQSLSLVRGYFWSICFMMSMPFLLLGALCTYFYFEVRKASKRAQTGEAQNRGADNNLEAVTGLGAP